jgi:hypothetical protein
MPLIEKRDDLETISSRLPFGVALIILLHGSVKSHRTLKTSYLHLF